jgi:hypothetical protein
LGVIFIGVLILQRVRQLHSMRVPVGSHWDCAQTFLIGILITNNVFMITVF